MVASELPGMVDHILHQSDRLVKLADYLGMHHKHGDQAQRSILPRQLCLVDFLQIYVSARHNEEANKELEGPHEQHVLQVCLGDSVRPKVDVIDSVLFQI